MNIILAVVLVVSVLAEDPCPSGNINNLYRELNCQPVFENASRCPSSYNCDRFEARNRAKCNYRGVPYEVGEMIPANGSDPCFPNCMCVSDEGEASFSCAVMECPEIWSPPIPEGCVRLYTEESCCSTGTYCPNGTSTRFSCEVDGTTYYEGQVFYPSRAPCKKCYCKEGFAGELIEPFCQHISCNVELGSGNRMNENCVPVYYGEDGCCPISWKCPPTQAARIMPSSVNDTNTSRAKCRFGKLEMNQHDVLEENGVRCECVVPPYLTCIGA